MLFWQREAFGGTGQEGKKGAGAVDTREWGGGNEIGHGGGVKSLPGVRVYVCMSATS